MRKLRRVQTWYKFHDVIMWYLLDLAGDPANHTTLAKLVKRHRPQISMILSGKRSFNMKDLDNLVELKKWSITKVDVLRKLHEIATKMEFGDIKKDHLEARIAAANRRGPKVPIADPQDLGPAEFMRDK